MLPRYTAQSYGILAWGAAFLVWPTLSTLKPPVLLQLFRTRLPSLGRSVIDLSCFFGRTSLHGMWIEVLLIYVLFR